MTVKLESISLLLIEDNPADAEIIRQFLLGDPSFKFKIVHASRFMDALEKVKALELDIALLDLTLPDSSSEETLERVQKDELKLPVIVLTGNDNQELGVRALQYGAQDYLVKDPVNYSNLSRTILFALERYNTLKALQASEERYRLLSEVSSDYMFAARVEPDGSVVQEWTTGAIEGTTGYTLEEYQEHGGWRSIVYPEDYWIDDQDMANLYARENVSSELRIVKKDQSIGWVHVKGLPLWDDENDRLVGIVGSTLDITQRKQNEIQLKNSEQRFKTMFDQAPIGIGLRDLETDQYLDINSHFANIIGRTEDEINSLTWKEITHPDDVDLGSESMNQLVAGEIDEFQLEKRYIRPDGSIVWVNVKITPITISSNNHRCVLTMVEDITAAKTAQKRLIESENRFRSLYEQAPIGITLTDSTTGKFIQVNPFFANMLGYSIAGLQSKKWMEITHPEDIDEDTGQMKRLLTGKINSFQMEKRFIHANGQIVWVDMKIAPLGLGESGNPIHISMVEDITEQKYSQERLVESENRFRLLYEQAPIPYQSLDEDGMVLEINDAWLNELGYFRTEVIGEYFAKFLTDQDAELFPQNFAQFKQLGEVHGIEYQMLHKDQHTIDVSFDGRIVRDTKGRFLQTHCVFTNVTERKRLQNALESRIVALTRPLEYSGDLTLTDLFDLEQIQQLQDDFSKATRVASIITQPDGTPITKPSNFCRLCNDIIRSTEKGRMNCFKSDAQLGRYNPKGPTVLPCLSSGLWDAGASISVGGQHIANWLIGQVRDETQSVDKMVEYANEIGADEDDVIKAFYEVPTMSQEQFNEISRILFTLSSQLSKMAYQNIQQARFITEQKQAEYEKERSIERLESLAAILQYPYEELEGFLEFALNEAIQLTDSKLGYLYFYDEETEVFELDTYSKLVMNECSIEFPQKFYQLATTGLWGEVVRQRKSIIINDYQAPHPKKKGVPEGHVPLTKFMTIPVFVEDRIVAVVGMANKDSDYNHQDELQLTLLMDNVWKVVERQRAIEELSNVSHRMQHYVDSSDVIIFAFDLTQEKAKATWCSENIRRILGYTPEDVMNPSWWRKNRHADEGVSLGEILREYALGNNDFEQDYRFQFKEDRHDVWINERIRILRDEQGNPTEAISAWTDITVRKQVEASAAESAAQLEAALSSMSDAVFISDENGYFTHFNEAFATFHKFESKKECSVYLLDWPKFIQVRTMDKSILPVKDWVVNRALRGEANANEEYELRRTDTGETWFGSYNYAPIFNKEGEIIGSVVTARDITEQKKLLQDIQQYAEDLNKAQSVAHVGSWKWNVLTDKLTWSDQMYTIFGIDKEDFTGHLPDVINRAVHPEDRAIVEASGHSVQNDAKPIPIEYRILHPDGAIRTVWAEAGELVTDKKGNPLILSGIVQDITERKQIEESAAESAARLETALSNMADAVFLTDAQGNITHFNHATATFFRFKTKEECASHFTNWGSYIEVMSMDGALILREDWSINRALRGEKESNIEYMFRRKDTGESWYGRYNFAPIQDEEGIIIGSVVTASDITEQKQAELAQLRNISRLESMTQVLQSPYENIEELMDLALEEAIELTDSQLGYILFYDDEIEEFTMFSWSEPAMAECAIPNPPETFKLKDTGIWGEVVRQRKALILNDYDAPHPQKKGYPEGHVRLEKFLTIPVFSGDRIVAAVGVANKKEDYTHEDELQLRLLMDNIWKVVERRKAVEELTDVSHRMQHYVDSSDVIIYAFNLYQDGLEMTWCSENVERILGYSADEVKTNGWWWKNKLGEEILSLEDIEQWDLRKSNDYEQDYQFRHLDGKPLWINEKTRLLRNKDGQATEAVVAWTDITKRKLMEESVKEGAATLEAALTSMSDAVLITDAQGNFTHISDSFIPFHRFSPDSTFGLQVSDWLPLIDLLNLDGSLVPPEDWLVPKALRGESGSNLEYMLRNKQNNETWYGRYNYGPFYNDAGEIIGAVVTGSDITEQKTLLQNIRQYAEDLNKAQSVAHVGSWKWNVRTNELTWSDQMYTIFGIDKDDFTGHLPDVIEKAIHPEDRIAVEASNNSVAEFGKPIPVEYRIVHPNGTIRTVWAEAGELVTDQDGNPLVLSGIVQDITERKQTEAQLLLQDTALNSAANSIVITDRDGNIQWINPAFSTLSGYSSDEVIGTNPRVLVKSGRHDTAFYKQLWDTILGGNTWRGDLTNRRKDGSFYEEYMTITPIQNRKGEITNFIAIKEDVTLRKHNEAEIKRHLTIQEKLVVMGRAFSSMIDIQLIYRTAYRYIREIIDVPNMAITLYDQEKAGLRRVFAINEGIVMDTSQFSMLPYLPDSEQSYRSRVIATQRPLITNNLVEKEKQSGSIFVSTTAMTPQSAIYVPLVAEYKVLGVLELQSYQQNAFTEESSEWLSVVANQIALAHQNANLYAQIRDRVSQLGGLREIDSAINAHQPLEYIYQIVFNQIQYHIRPDAADILLLPEDTDELFFQSGYGFHEANSTGLNIPVGCGLAGACAALKKQIIHNGPDEYDEYLAGCKKWKEEGFKSYIGIPIIIHHECVGVLEVFHRTQMSLHPEDMQYLQTLAGQVAIAIESNTLISDLRDTANDLMKAYDATIEGWSMAMDLRDRDTEGHTQRVTTLTMKFAEAAGYPQEEMEHLRRGALLHDIGKLGVPDYILLKPGKLDPDEWNLMKQHPTMAYDMLKQVEYLLPALDIPKYHHERWDGSGYPEGLSGEEIPLSARIFAFVDVWDAVTNDRPYKEAWSREKALQLIKNDTGSHFDPRLAEIFIGLILSEEKK